MASENILQIDGASFDSTVLESDTPVMVDFWAPWCGPCLAVAPVLDELAGEMAGKVQIAKLNIDENQEVAAKYQVTSIPTFILFKDGEIADRMLGAMPKAAFKDFLGRNV